MTIDFVVVPDRAQLSELVQRLRHGRLRTNIGNVAALTMPLRPFNRPSGPRERRSFAFIVRIRNLPNRPRAYFPLLRKWCLSIDDAQAPCDRSDSDELGKELVSDMFSALDRRIQRPSGRRRSSERHQSLCAYRVQVGLAASADGSTVYRKQR